MVGSSICKNCAGARPEQHGRSAANSKVWPRGMEAVADDARLTAHLGYTQWVACNFLRIKKSTHSATPLPPNFRSFQAAWKVLWKHSGLNNSTCSATHGLGKYLLVDGSLFMHKLVRARIPMKGLFFVFWFSTMSIGSPRGTRFGSHWL